MMIAYDGERKHLQLMKGFRLYVWRVEKCPPASMYCYRTRFRSGRNAAVHRSAKDALQVPALLYGAYAIHTCRLFSSPRSKNSGQAKIDRNFVEKVPVLFLDKSADPLDLSI